MIRKTYVRPLVAAAVLATAAASGAARAQVVLPPGAEPLPTISLKNVPVPDPTNLQAFLNRNNPQAKTALKQLGKALFWDMRLGSDDMTACASCHFNAGVDNRSKNQLEPGSHAIQVGAALPGSPDVNPTTGAGNFGNTEITGVPSPVSKGFLFAPNFQLTAANFPLHRRFLPTTPGDGFANSAQVSMDTNDIVSSQGIKAQAGDPLFNWNGRNVRRVAGRNAPSAINAAVSSYDQFWDGRGRFIFNGVSPTGFLDRAAMVKHCTNTSRPNCAAGAIEAVKVSIPYGSHASQSVGPPLSDRELSGHVRNWPAIAAKLLRPLRAAVGSNNIPLATQLVSATDSVLGPLANSTPQAQAVGLKTTYDQLIRQAFSPEWWDGTVAGTPSVRLIEANFPMFFGLALEAYQNTLVADDTPLDRFLGSAGQALAPDRYPANQTGAAPDPQALTAQQQRGLQVFRAALCNVCHALPVTSNASPFQLPVGGVAGLIPVFVPPLAREFDPAWLQANGFGTQRDALGLVRIVNNPNYRENFLVPNLGIEAMPMNVAAPGQAPLGGQFLGVYDVGFYNLGRRPTEEDIGRGNSKPSGVGSETLPLSYTELTLMKLRGTLPQELRKFMPDQGVLCNPIPPAGQTLPPGAVCIEQPNTSIVEVFRAAGNRTVVRGSFKVPNLRNQKFMGPYFHDGGEATLRHVVEFYTRGGNFPVTNELFMTPDMPPIPLLDVSGATTPAARTAAENNIQDLVEFLANALNDPRVVSQKPPFDHPQLIIPVGENISTRQPEAFQTLGATGVNGGVSSTSFLGLNPQSR